MRDGRHKKAPLAGARGASLNEGLIQWKGWSVEAESLKTRSFALHARSRAATRWLDRYAHNFTEQRRISTRPEAVNLRGPL